MAEGIQQGEGWHRFQPNMGVTEDLSAAWGSASWLLYAQIAIIPVNIALTFYLQSQKTDYFF